MGDIRLKKSKIEYRGKTYTLTVNMNVLADLQELHDGDLSEVLTGKRSMKTVLEITAAAMNDFADENGWEDRVTARELGRSLSAKEFKDICEPMVDLLIAAIKAQDDQTEEDEKNATTTQMNHTA